MDWTLSNSVQDLVNAIQARGHGTLAAYLQRERDKLERDEAFAREAREY